MKTLFNVDLDRFLIDSGAINYSANVIEYTRDIYETMKEQDREKYENFFNKNDITVIDFLNVFMSRAQSKLNEGGDEVLNAQEFNKVFSDLLVYKEFLDFLMKDKMGIESINSKGELIYRVGDEVRDHFKKKYGVDI
jgi:hypothetical protein